MITEHHVFTTDNGRDSGRRPLGLADEEEIKKEAEEQEEGGAGDDEEPLQGDEKVEKTKRDLEHFHQELDALGAERHGVL